MSRSLEKNNFVAKFVAAIIVLTVFVAFGWWAFSFSTHTLVWLSFMGLSLGGWASRIDRK